MNPTRKPYKTDLTDEQWEIIEPLLPDAKEGGRPRTTNLREVLNAIFYLKRTGCQWENLPHDFPPSGTVYDYFRKWIEDGTWEKLNTMLRGEVRKKVGKEETPSAGVVDSQSVKTTEEARTETKGFDGGKRTKGRKRHILVDTLGLLLAVYVSPANTGDRKGAKELFKRLKIGFPRLKIIWADGGYEGKEFLKWVAATYHWIVEIVKRTDDLAGFQVVPKRWIVERTFGWLNRERRLSKDYERLLETSEAFIQVAMVHLMVRRLA